MAFPGTFPTSGGGGGQDFGDPAIYAGAGQGTGQSQDDSMLPGNQPPQAKPSEDFVRAMGRQGMQLKTTLQTLSGQHPEAAEDFRQAIKAVDAGIAKILTTNPQATSGTPAPRTV